jgi:hypothetical protein
MEMWHYTTRSSGCTCRETTKTLDFVVFFLSFSVASIHKKEVAHHGNRYCKVVQ